MRQTAHLDCAVCRPRNQEAHGKAATPGSPPTGAALSGGPSVVDENTAPGAIPVGPTGPDASALSPEATEPKVGEQVGGRQAGSILGSGLAGESARTASVQHDRDCSRADAPDPAHRCGLPGKVRSNGAR